MTRYMHNFTYAFVYTCAIKKLLITVTNYFKNAIHNVDWGVAVSAHSYKMN